MAETTITVADESARRVLESALWDRAATAFDDLEMRDAPTASDIWERVLDFDDAERAAEEPQVRHRAQVIAESLAAIDAIRATTLGGAVELPLSGEELALGVARALDPLLTWVGEAVFPRRRSLPRVDQLELILAAVALLEGLPPVPEPFKAEAEVEAVAR
ncbi:hypothetical protein [Conexibacter sp. DBS9H8]|uniref:hypothetical protein n=1 Tax=Conexibacter sp. DBS9H8 TaxID=2937801 RepID=UPI00200F2188|nr:hypothetical protein [Conexibacter sp. DBS9H8]